MSARLTDRLTLRTLPQRDRRAVLLGLAVLVPALVWIGAGRPYRAALAELHDRIETERSLLQREEALLAQGETMPGSMETVLTRADRAALRLVRAANVPLAEAELIATLESVANMSRVLLQEARGIEPRRGQDAVTGELRSIRLAIRGESDLEGVLTFLQRLETSPLLLRVAELSIEPQFEGARAERRPTGFVTFALVIEGYVPADIERNTSQEALQ